MPSQPQNLENEIRSLADRVAALERDKSLIVPIETLAPQPYEVLKPFHIVLEPRQDEYMAVFHDANIATCGETQEEAILNLKDLIVAFYENLSELGESRLGPGPARQLKVLQQFIRRYKEDDRYQQGSGSEDC